MATKPNMEPANAPDTGAFLLLDDFLNLIHDEIQKATGQVHIESISAFATTKRLEGIVKQDVSKWRADYEAFLKSVPR